MLIYPRLELKFSFSLTGVLKRLRGSTTQNNLVKGCRSLPLRSPLFKLDQTMLIYSEFLEVSRVTHKICTLTGVVSVGSRYGHEVGLEMKGTPSL